MADKPTYEALQQRVKQLEKEVWNLKGQEDALKDYVAYQSVLAVACGAKPEQTEEMLLQAFLTEVVRQYGFCMSWYGIYANGEIRPIVSAGRVDRYLDNLVLEIREPTSPDAQCAMSHAILSGAPFSYADLERDEGFRKWRDYAVELGYRSNLALPLRVDDQVEGGVMVYADTPNAFPKERVERLELLTVEIGAILHGRRLKQKAEEAIHKAQKELEQRVEERTAELVKANEQLKHEIKERKQAEEAIERITNEQAVLLSTVPVMIFWIDKEGNFIRVNDSFATALHKSPDDIEGKSLFDLYPEDMARYYYNDNLEVIESGTPKIYITEPVETPAGTMWVRTDKIPHRDEKGEIVGIIGFSEDITERKRAERMLKSQLGLQQVVATVSRSFINLAPNEIDNGINLALETMGALSEVDRSYVFLFYDNGKMMNNTHEWCAEGIEPQIENLKGLSADMVPWWMDKLNRFKNIHIPCVADLPPEASAEKEILQAQDIQSLFVVPMVYGSSLLGFIGFDSVRVQKTWPEESIALLRLVAEIFAGALERRRVEEALEKSNDELKAQAESLEQLNVALNVLLERREKDKEELEEKVVYNVKELVLPYLESLKKSRLDVKQMTCVNIVESNLKEIISPFLRKLASEYFGLTPKEIQIAALIKQGKTTKEIAEFLSVSTSAVQFHRHNIRAKLGLKNEQANLGTYLSSLS